MASPYKPTKTILIDFDGTICPFTWPYPPPPPFPGAVETINRLVKQGYYIVIFSARFWSGWDTQPDTEGSRASRRRVAAYLRAHGILYHELSAEKRPCLLIIDDSALGAPDMEVAWSGDDFIESEVAQRANRAQALGHA